MTVNIAVMGAGCVGGWMGARIAASGTPVTLIARDRFIQNVRDGGLHATSIAGSPVSVAAASLSLGAAPELVKNADFVLVCVKSRDTAAAARALAPHLHQNAVVVSLQNGLANVERLRAGLPDHTVLAAMVRFNIVWTDQTPGVHLVQATSGEVLLEQHPSAAPFESVCRAAGIPTFQHPEMARIQWAKLLLNLNNAINALSGCSLRDELSNRAYRQVLAAAMGEAWTVFRAAGIEPASFRRMQPALALRILPLPDLLFRILAAPMIRIDPTARSSMADDLALGRTTEIDDINGTIVALGARFGVPTPINAHLVALVRAAEARGNGSPQLPPGALWPTPPAP